MKLLIIRHGDPDYTIDSLTEKGHREAELLSERIAPMEIAARYISYGAMAWLYCSSDISNNGLH